MIKSWIFEFLHAPEDKEAQADPNTIKAVFDDNIRLWVEMEDLGYEGVFFSEHHFQGQAYSPSPNLLIAAIAQRTARLRLGVMGVVLPFYPPWRVLEEIGMLDHLSGGRLEIGCASGIPQELIRVGLEMGEARERFDEIIEVLDKNLGKPRVSHKGKYWEFEDLLLLPVPLQQPAPPVWTTIVSENSARKSARRGSKICTSFESVSRITEFFDAYREEADKAGRPAAPDDLAIRRNISIAASESEAAELSSAAKEYLKRIMAGDTRAQLPDKSLLDAPAKGAGFSVAPDEFIHGTPVRVAEQIIEQCRAVGAGHFLGMLGRGSLDKRRAAVHLFGEQVVPILRKAAL